VKGVFAVYDFPMEDHSSTPHYENPVNYTSPVFDTRESLARRIGIIGVVATLLLSVITIIAALSGSSQSFSTASDQSVDPIPDSSWVPEGYTLSGLDPNVAYKWVTRENTCDSYTCSWASFVSLAGCPNSFYAAVNELDSSDSVIGYANASLPSLQPMQFAKLRFDDTSNSAKSSQLSEIHCR
jgi:hypothetical protein